MVKIENGKLTIELEKIHADGETLRDLQEALIIGLQEIGDSDVVGDASRKKASFYLNELLLSCLLNSSQTNIAIGGKPYKDPVKS